MEKPNALVYFRGKERYNCAQAVLKAYASSSGMGDTCLERFSCFGNGRAPEGECGALFAAKALLHDLDAKKRTEEEFVDAAGHKTCRDIRKSRKFSCEECVKTAADVVFTQLSRGHLLQPPQECSS